MSSINEIVILMEEAFKKNLTFSFPINGTSMQPLLHKGDIVNLRECRKASVGDIVFYKRGDNYILHRVLKVKNDVYTIVGDHQIQCDKNVLPSMIIGVVVAYKKKGKDRYNNLKGLRYRIYRFLVKFRLVRYINSKLF